MPELDSLRFFAFLAVFIFHSFSQETPYYIDRGLPGWAASVAVSIVSVGWCGVDLFFLLSSYLITSLLVREQERIGRIDLRAFYFRRALRIWPLYFFFILIAGVIMPPLFPFIDPLKKHEAVSLLTFTLNWDAGFRGLGLNPANVLWSVSLEEQFYAAWPIVIFFAGVKRLRSISIFILLALILIRVGCFFAGINSALTSPTILRWEPMALGVLIAVVPIPPISQLIRISLLLLGLFLPILCTASGINPATTYPIVAASCGLILVSIVGESGFCLRNPVLTYLGKISYGLYVYHILILKLSGHINIGSHLPLIRNALALGLTILTAALSYRYIETPFLRLKNHFARIQSRPI